MKVATKCIRVFRNCTTCMKHFAIFLEYSQSLYGGGKLDCLPPHFPPLTAHVGSGQKTPATTGGFIAADYVKAGRCLIGGRFQIQL